MAINIFENIYLSKLINLSYKKSVIKSHNRAIKRDLYYDFYNEFKSFVSEYKHINYSDQLITFIESKNNIIAEHSKVNQDNIYESISKFNFLNRRYKNSIIRFNICKDPNLNYLKNKYIENIGNDKHDEFVNDDFLSIYCIYFGEISLYSLIELYIDIILDFKEFDGIYLIEDLIFTDKINPIPFFYNGGGFSIFHKAIECYQFLNQLSKSSLILENLFVCMDKAFDTNNNKLVDKYSTIEYGFYTYDGQEKGVIQKKDRDLIRNKINKLEIPNWQFSNKLQVENAFRFNLISEEKYNKKIKLFNSKEIDYQKIISNFPFLNLEIDASIYQQQNRDEYIHNPTTNDFNDLTELQKSEYVTAYSKFGNRHKIIKYGKYRIERLLDSFRENKALKENVINELLFIKDLTHFKYEINIVIENINSYKTLKTPELLNKIQKAKATIKNVGKAENKTIYVKFSDKYYQFYLDIEEKDAVLLPEEVLDLIISGGNCDEKEFLDWDMEYNNFDVIGKANNIDEKIHRGEFKNLVATKKSDAKKLSELLQREYDNFIPYFKKNVKKNQYSRFIDPLISRLMSCYITLNEFQKAIDIAYEFEKIKEEYTQIFLTPEAQKITLKKQICIEKINFKYLSYEESKEVMSKIGLKSIAEWKEYKKTALKPKTIPNEPNKIYKDNGWTGFQDWLGYSNNKSNFLSFEDAKKYIHTLELKSENEWKLYKKQGLRPDFIPGQPDEVYKEKGWKGYQDWLGYKRSNSNFLSFESAKKSMHPYNLKSKKDWIIFLQNGLKPSNIPSNPEKVYKEKGWKGYQDWLGYIYKPTKFEFLSFEEAKLFIHSLGLKSENEWKEFKRKGLKPDNIPGKPEEVYKEKGWKGFQDWLGYIYKPTKFNFLTFDEAKQVVHSLGLKSENDWRVYKRNGLKPDNIPGKPEEVYKGKGWKGFKEWLGY